MTSSNDRLDQIEALRPHSIIASDRRMTRIEERLGQLAESQEVTDAQVGVLVTAIDTLAVRVDRVVDYLENHDR